MSFSPLVWSEDRNATFLIAEGNREKNPDSLKKIGSNFQVTEKSLTAEFKNPWDLLVEFTSARTANLAACGEKSEIPNWRREGFLNPFCHLMFKAVRSDSPPCGSNRESLNKTLSDAQLRLGLTRPQFAAKLNITIVTLANWERGRTKPARRLWKAVCRLRQEHLNDFFGGV